MPADLRIANRLVADDSGAQIGVNVTILLYVTIGESAIIGSRSVVTKDISPGMVAYGNPARPTRRVEELRAVETRLRKAYTARMAASRSSVVASNKE